MKKMFFTALFILKITVLTILGFVLTYVALGYILSIWGVNKSKPKCDETHQAYISTNGVHLDLILPVETLEAPILQMLQPEQNIRYIAFGWGDKGFYLDTPTWAELKASTALKAMFWKSPTAVHVTRYAQRSNQWRSMGLCAFQLAILKKHIFDSFQRKIDGQIIKIEGAGYGPNDDFYEAHGTYTCVKTCNVWVNQALKKAQIKTSVWSPSDFGVLYHLD